MNLTNDEKQELTELAKLPGLSAHDIAIIMGIKPSLFDVEIAKKESDIYMAYFKGRLLTKAELSKKIKQLSDQGSGPAQSLLAKLIKEQDYNEILNLYNENEQD